MKIKKDIRKLVRKEMPEFVDEVNSLTSENIMARLTALAQNAEDVQQSKEDDTELQDAKNAIQCILEPYRDATKHIKLKTKYLLLLLKDRSAT